MSPTVEGLDPIVDRIVEEAEDLAYLTLTDRTDASNVERLGRLDATPVELDPWLDEDTGGDGRASFTSPAQLEPDVLERAIHRWAYQLALQHAVGGELTRFRLRAYAVKGHKVLGGGCFVVHAEEQTALSVPVHETGLAPRDQVDSPQTFTESFEELEIEGSRPGMRALGSYYAQWGGMMLSSVRQINGVHQEMIDRLHQQVGEGRGQVDELLAALLETRAAASMVQVHEDAEARRQHANTVLAQQAIAGIGEAAKAFALAKTGLDPQLTGLAERLAESPELLEALQSEDVRRLMADPDNLKLVAQMLKQAAKAARTAETAKAAAGRAASDGSGGSETST